MKRVWWLIILLITHPAWAMPMGNLHFQDMQGAPADIPLGKPVLIAFWRSDCAPCLHELTLLPDIAKQHPDLSIMLVSLQDAEHTRAHVSPMPANVHVLVAKDDAKTVLAAFGNDRVLALPYSVMLDSKGQRCDWYYGIIAPEKVKEWQKKCS